MPTPTQCCFFLFRRRSGSVARWYLGVAARGFFSVGDFLALLSWDKSVGYLRQVGDIALVSASACSVTKFFSFATIVIMGESMSGFHCYSQECPAKCFVGLPSLHSVSVLSL